MLLGWMDILESCEIHEVSHGPMIHTQLVPHKIVKLTFFSQNSFSGYYTILENLAYRGVSQGTLMSVLVK